MLVHISVNTELRHDTKAMTRLMQEIVDTSGMQGVNADRFHKFAVLSGHIDPGRIADIEALEHVTAVEPDTERFPLQ
ncbi:MAG: hypothetical protein ACYTCU_06030 [Planctomycetota bacterium]|jgi:hypothetical protein